MARANRRGVSRDVPDVGQNDRSGRYEVSVEVVVPDGTMGNAERYLDMPPKDFLDQCVDVDKSIAVIVIRQAIRPDNSIQFSLGFLLYVGMQCKRHEDSLKHGE